MITPVIAQMRTVSQSKIMELEDSNRDKRVTDSFIHPNVHINVRVFKAA